MQTTDLHPEVARLADEAMAHAARAVEDGVNGAAEQLRDVLHAELDRVGTTVGLLDAFELTPTLRAARLARIKVDEDYLSRPDDHRLLATVLVPVFAATAFYERRMRLLNAGRGGASTTACPS